MYIINHNDATELEYQVRRLYKCDRGGVSGLVDADYFERYPVQAAVLVVAYIYAKELDSEPYQFDEFLTKYKNIFEYSEESDMEAEVKNYIEALGSIVDQYQRG